MKHVLDSSAVLAMILGEPGGEEVHAAIPASEISTVNLCEVHTRLIDGGMTADEVRAHVARLELRSVDFSELHAAAAAALRPRTAALGLSLGDRACLAHAQLWGLPVMTADRVWARLDLGIDIRLIR